MLIIVRQKKKIDVDQSSGVLLCLKHNKTVVTLTEILRSSFSSLAPCQLSHTQHVSINSINRNRFIRIIFSLNDYINILYVIENGNLWKKKKIKSFELKDISWINNEFKYLVGKLFFSLFFFFSKNRSSVLHFIWILYFICISLSSC